MQPLVRLAEFVSTFPADRLPENTRKMISRLLIDLIASTAAGLNTPLAVSARAAMTSAYGSGPVTVWLTGKTSSIIGAAMANSAAASSLDLDDGHRAAAGHAGAGVIPAALAVAEATGASTDETLAAIALGYDIALRVASCRPAPSVSSYASGLWVNYGAAAAAARLLRLDIGQTAAALGIAGGEGPIVFTTPDPKFEGSTVKEGIPPAVVAGMTAAYRAQSSATGPLDHFDDPARFDPAVLFAGLGEVWEVEKCYLKPYACCRYMHAALDAIFDLRDPRKEIKSLKIETFPQSLRLANERAPTTSEGAQYSFYFNCALAAIHGRDALLPVDPKHLHDPDVLALAARIELSASSEFSSAFPARTPARVLIDQGDGIQEKLVLHPLGDVANPMSEDQIIEKLQRLAAELGVVDTDEIVSCLLGIETKGIRPLFEALSQNFLRESHAQTQQVAHKLRLGTDAPIPNVPASRMLTPTF